MPINPVAENVFGTLGTICWSGQILPQIWKSYREKSTEGLSHWLMFIWSISAAFLGVFAVTQNLNIPLILQPQLFGFLGLVSWSQVDFIFLPTQKAAIVFQGSNQWVFWLTSCFWPHVDNDVHQCLHYGHKKSLTFSLCLLVAMVLILGGFEAGMIFAIRPAVRGGNQRPVQFFGIMTSILLSAGLIPQFFEIYRFGEVKGISIPFMLIDFLGGVFSDLSLAFKPKFDVFGGIAYSLVIVLDATVLILALLLNPRAERRRKRLLETVGVEEAQGIEELPIDHPPPNPDSGLSSKRESTLHSDEKSGDETNTYSGLLPGTSDGDVQEMGGK